MSLGMQYMNMSLDDMIKQDRKMAMKKNHQKRRVQNRAPIRRIWTSAFKVEMPGASARNFQRQQKSARGGANQVRNITVFWEDREWLSIPVLRDERNEILMGIGSMTVLMGRKPKFLRQNQWISVCLLKMIRSAIQTYFIAASTSTVTFEVCMCLAQKVRLFIVFQVFISGLHPSMDKSMLDELFSSVGNYQGIDMDMDSNNNFRVSFTLTHDLQVGFGNDNLLHKRVCRSCCRSVWQSECRICRWGSPP